MTAKEERDLKSDSQPKESPRDVYGQGTCLSECATLNPFMDWSINCID